MKLHAYLVDDEPLALERLRRLLENTGRVEVTGSTTVPEEAVAALTADPPDICFLDIQMPRLDGFEVLARLPSPADRHFHDSLSISMHLKAFESELRRLPSEAVEPESLERALAKVERLRGSGRLRQLDLQDLLKTPDGLAARESNRSIRNESPRGMGDRLWFLNLVRVTHFYRRRQADVRGIRRQSLLRGLCNR